jgi:serine/threonine protein phosphatase PrpC
MNLRQTSLGMTLAVETLSHMGSHSHNEDARGYWTSPGASCFVVSNDAGGHAGETIASEIAIKSALSAFANKPGFGSGLIREALSQAEQSFKDARQIKSELADMTATLATRFLDTSGAHARWLRVGDTRIYVFRRDRARQLTRDHSMVQNLVDVCCLAPEGLRRHPERSLLLAALGMDGDGVGPTISEFEFEFETSESDEFLICSDGRWEGITKAGTEDALLHASSVEEWLIRLEQRVIGLSKPNQDNYTALAVWLGNPQEITRLPA